MTDWFSELAKLGRAVIKRTRLGNVMSSPLVLAITVLVTTVPAFIITRFWPILVITAVPIAYFVRAFEYFMKHNPRLLRSEEHEERMYQLAVGMGREGRELPEEQIYAMPPITNPEAPESAIAQPPSTERERPA
jgi:hypothetical protein